jgi:ABC-2 type transport system permease protein
MHNIWLIAKREYLERIRTKGFIIATVLIPTLMGGGIAGMAILAGNSKTAAHIAIVATTTQPAADLKEQLENGKDSNMRVDIVNASPDVVSTLDKQIQDKKLDGYLVVKPGPEYDFKPRSSADIATTTAVTDALHHVLTREHLAEHGISADAADTLLKAPTVNIIDPSGRHGDSKKAFLVAYVLFFLMYMVVLLYGMNVARSIIEEKTSRVFEVLLATIKPDELLAGKILGVGAVGLTQVGVWMTAAALFAAKMGAISGIEISATQVIFFIIYFALGYALYSSVAAALGAMTNSEQELQQLNLFLMMPLFFCMLMLAPIIQNPSSTLARVVSQIPFCAPLLMNFRISLAMPSKWEIASSICLIIVTIMAVLWVSARIYRVGILMYGKKPSMPEILRWLKYS